MLFKVESSWITLLTTKAVTELIVFCPYEHSTIDMDITYYCKDWGSNPDAWPKKNQYFKNMEVPKLSLKCNKVRVYLKKFWSLVFKYSFVSHFLKATFLSTRNWKTCLVILDLQIVLKMKNLFDKFIFKICFEKLTIILFLYITFS
jgi:hypothetical protein